MENQRQLLYRSDVGVSEGHESVSSVLPKALNHNSPCGTQNDWLEETEEVLSPTTQSSINTEPRPGCLGLCYQMLKTCKTGDSLTPLGPVQMTGCPNRENVFIIFSWNLFCFNL